MSATALRVSPIATSAERAAWDELAASSPVGHRHQCLWWMEPLERYGVRSRALGCWKGNQLVGGALFRSYPIPFTGASIIECLDGPIFLAWEDGWADEFLAGLIDFSRTARSMAVVIRDCRDENVHRGVVAALRRRGLAVGLSPGPTDAVLQLKDRTMDQIRAGFSHGTRGRIKKGQKGISIRRLTGTQDLAQAYEAWIATARRKGFTDVRPWLGLEAVLRHCIDQDRGMVLASFVDERLLAAAFVTHIGTTASWVYGGYMDGAEKQNPTHVLQDEAIKESLARGMVEYNFGYLLAEYQPSARGVDEFKLGFGAEPSRHLETITWKRRPLLYSAVQGLRGGPVGRLLETVFKKRLIQRGEA
ncbi:MAG: lipid II:glycine glycyltransferase FemX [Gemmatimonadales bacterium]